MTMSYCAEKIEKYFNGTSQYPLFVVVPPDEYADILKSFSNTPKIKVSDYCVDIDKEPDTKKLRDDAGNIIGNYLLLGLGDYLANKGLDAKNILSSYKSLMLPKDSHLVILLASHMFSVVKEMVNDDLRLKSRVILPQITPSIPNTDNTAFVYGIKAYLDSCEKGITVGNVKTARQISNAVVINPENAFGELKQKFPNEFNKLSQVNGSVENWSKLLSEINKSTKNILQYLGDQGFASPEYIFLEYVRSNDYKAWLYFIWLKLHLTSQNYLGYIAAKSDSKDLLLDIAISTILDIDISDKRFFEFYTQRKTLLKDCNESDMAKFMPQIYRRGSDRIAYLTDNTKVEKQWIIVALGEGAKADYLEHSYPDLYSYLQDYKFNEDWLTSYFIDYKKYKVVNKVPEAFKNIVRSNGVNRPYNSLPSRTAIFSTINKEKTLLIFLDAMGVEFLGYIKSICAQLKLRPAKPHIARANLPTITSTNREFYDDWKGSKETRIKGIDNLKHHPERGYDFNNPTYPIHLPEELDTIREALERAKIKLSTGEYRKIILASDHGASRLAVICPDNQVESNGCESKSNGRYCQGDFLPTANNIAPEGNCAILADYSRFIGSRIASVEVHGGATLEEVVVPIIEITLADSNIQVLLENDTIEANYKNVPELFLIITPDCDDVSVSVNGVYYIAERVDISRYKIILQDLKKGKYVLNVFENQNPIGSKEFTIKPKGFSERKMF